MKSNNKPYILHVAERIYIEIFKIKNKYRTRLLLRFSSNLFAQKLINKILKKIKISKKIKLMVDVDPINFA